MSGRGYSGGNPAMGDILRSVLVLGLVLVVIYGIGQLIYGRDPESPAPKVDYATAAQTSQRAADFGVLVPAELPDGWQSNSARFEPGERGGWHLGVLTADDEYIGLEQFKRSEAQLVREFADGAEDAGTVDIDGRTWRVLKGAENPVVLVTTIDDTAVLVTATAPRAQVEDYVATLRPAGQPASAAPSAG
ncbi:DUF4245 domain-containing protein [Aeromicrobium sp. IC_218]|uniref:DUF4245 domain-containing protein n=1 Tax=Aeromicrobium sp. IC_218 TaxID=2545468 RepID=UPI0013F462A5|nr:DUF4245 domain-containing protein [Aeromicrobium sp. IC_218]